MKICLIHAHRPSREVIARALRRSFNTDVVTFSCCEDLLAVPLAYDVFIVYNNFEPRKMRGLGGATKIRAQRPDAFIIGVSTVPHFGKRFMRAGANATLLRAGNEIAELVGIIRQKANLNQDRSVTGAHAAR